MASHHWNAEINHLLLKIERETEQSIQKLQKSLKRCGLRFDQKFRKFFLRSTDNRLGETFDRFEIDRLEEKRHRDRQLRSVNRSYGNHHQNYGYSRSHANSLERSTSYHRRSRSRSRSLQVANRKRAKLSIKDRLGTPVKKKVLVQQRLSPIPSTSRQQPINETQAPDEPIDDIGDNIQETIDMSDLDSILNKCISEPSKALSSLDDLMFICSYCHNNDNFPNACSHDIDDIYAHWLSGHTDLPHVQAFAFFIVDINTACYYCNHIGTLQQMLKHQKECHRNRSIAMVNPDNRQECAFCNYSDGKWLDHFQLNHKMLAENDMVNPISLTNEQLMQLLAINVHKKRQCLLCSETFETQHQFDDHSAREHADQLDNVAKIVDASSKMHLICDVCHDHIDPDAFLAHLEEHTYDLTCSKCDFSTDDLVHLAHHDQQAHQCDSLNFHFLQFSERLQRHYFHTKVVFDNGLMMTKHNLLNTSYNDYDEFWYMIETMVDIKMKKFHWLMQAQRSREAVRNGLRPQSNDDDDDMNSVSTNGFLHSTMVSSQEQSSLSLNGNRAASDRPLRHEKLLKKHFNPNYDKQLRKQLRLLKNICIHGIPRREDENLRDIVLRVFDKLGADVSSNQIGVVHRLSKSDPLIIVKFANIAAKQRVMIDRRNKEVFTHDVINMPPDVLPSKIHIYAQLTTYFEELRLQAKHYMKIGRLVSYSLTQSGFVVRRTKHSMDHLVCSKDDLRLYVMGF